MLKKLFIYLLLNFIFLQLAWSQDLLPNNETLISNSLGNDLNHQDSLETKETTEEKISKSFSVDEAPYIGGMIRNKKYKNNFIRLICMEIKNDQCISYAFVSVFGEKRTQLSPHIFPIEQLKNVKKSKVKVNGDFFELFPFTTSAVIITAVFGGIGGFLLLPIDLITLPVRGPILIITKLKMKKSLKILTNLKETKMMTLKDIPFDDLTNILKALKPKSNL